MMLKNIVTWP